MKPLASLLVTLLATSAFAADKEAKPRPIPMYTRVDTIDLAGKSFTHKNKDGREVRFILTSQTSIRNNGVSAKFEDIKVGDVVAGSRYKKSDTEYELKSITRFAPATPKPASR